MQNGEQIEHGPHAETKLAPMRGVRITAGGWTPPGLKVPVSGLEASFSI